MVPAGSCQSWLGAAAVSSAARKEGKQRYFSPVCSVSLSACHDSCSTCEGPLATHCTSCPRPLALRQGQCLQDCGEGFYQDHDVCKGKICAQSSSPAAGNRHIHIGFCRDVLGVPSCGADPSSLPSCSRREWFPWFPALCFPLGEKANFLKYFLVPIELSDLGGFF